ncbi:MAG: helix-turn-helix domain-containing protein [Halobacteriales archaeon]|nr:helix-turn-helix domain-containing protein [Halobacteriales archaeon]
MEARAGGEQVRAAICRYLRESPGAHFRDLQRRLDLSPGQTTHHLRVLERDGLVVERRQGRYTHFFPAGTPIETRGTLGALRHPARKTLVDVLAAGPCTLKDLGARAGLAPSTLHHHVRVLREAGVIEAHGSRPRMWGLVRGLPPAEHRD